IRKVAVVLLALVLELTHVVSEDDVHRVDAREALLQILAVSLNGRAERPQVHTVRTDADGPAAAARAEGQDLAKAVEQSGPLFAGDEPFDLRPIRRKFRAREPQAQVVSGLSLERLVGVEAGESGGDTGQQVHE